MSLKIGESTSFTVVDKGTYPARLVQVVDLGVQEVQDYETKKNKLQNRVYFTYELPDETITINGVERPQWISKDYNVSYFESSDLTKVISVLNPEADTLFDLLGHPCMLEVGHTSGGKAKVTNISHVPKRMEVGSLDNPTLALDLSEFDLTVFNKLPEWLRKKISNSMNREAYPDIPRVGEDSEQSF